MHSEANYVYLNDDYFLKNNAFEGGGIYLNTFSNSILVFRAKKCIFMKNEGCSAGGAIFFRRLITLDSFIDKSYMNGKEARLSCIFYGSLN